MSGVICRSLLNGKIYVKYSDIFFLFFHFFTSLFSWFLISLTFSIIFKSTKISNNKNNFSVARIGNKLKIQYDNEFAKFWRFFGKSFWYQLLTATWLAQSQLLSPCWSCWVWLSLSSARLVGSWSAGQWTCLHSWLAALKKERSPNWALLAD